MKGKSCVTPNCKGCDDSPIRSHRYKLRSLSKKQESAYQESLGVLSGLQCQDESIIQEDIGELSGFQAEDSNLEKTVEEELGELSGIQDIDPEDASGGVFDNDCGHEIPVSKNLGADCYEPYRQMTFGEYF